MTGSAESAGWREIWRPGQRAGIVLLSLGVWLHAANSMLVATTMPRAIQDIGGASLIGWTFMLYQLGSIVAGTATGLLIARLGLIRAFVLAAACYAFGCAVCALAPAMTTLLVGRVAQGLGGGAMLGLTYVAIGRWFPARLTPKLIALTSVIWSASAFCGPLVGGGFASAGLWRFAFWAFCLQAVLFIVLLLAFYRQRDIGVTAPENHTTVPFGRLGVLTLAVLLIAMAGAGTDLEPQRSAALGALAFVGFWLFLRLDRASAQRMLPSRPLDLRYPVGAGLAMVLTLSLATMSFLVYGTLLLDVLHDVEPLAAGYIVALESVGWGIAAMLLAGTRAQYEGVLIRLGSVFVTAGVVGFALWMPSGPLAWVLVAAVLQGAGFGMMWGFVVRRVVAGAPGAERERAATALPAIQQVGFAIGAAAAGVVANGVGFADGVSLASAERVAFWVFMAFVPIALVGNYAAWRLARPASNVSS